MSNVVPLRKRDSLLYRFVKNVRAYIDPTFFVCMGAFMVLPQLIASSTFGGLLAVILGTSAMVAISIGVANYCRFHARNESFLCGEASPASFSEEFTGRKAA